MGHHAGGGASEASAPDAIEISGAELPVDTTSGGRAAQQQRLDGIYLREWDVNGAPHFKRRSKVWEEIVRAPDALRLCKTIRRVCFSKPLAKRARLQVVYPGRCKLAFDQKQRGLQAE